MTLDSTIPLAKRVIKKCHDYKRHQTIGYAIPPPGPLSTTCNEGRTAFQMIEIDFTGSLQYRISNGKEKSCVLLYADNFSTAIYLHLLHSMEMSVLTALKVLISEVVDES